MDAEKIIIIGATSGIGKGLAIKFLEEGFAVGISGRRKELLENFRVAYPENLFTECFDVTGSENIDHVNKLISQLGGMDLLIYNSGYGEPSEDLDWKIDLQTTHTNVNGFAEIINFAFNYFKKQGHGHIVGISSIAAIRGGSFAPAYNASKAFISNYLEGLQIKSRKQKLNIFITDIQPGFIRTKPGKGNRRFWVISPEKAVSQMYLAISTKKRKAYISRRWIIIAWIIKWLPFSIYKKLA